VFECANAWGGKAKLSDICDASPNSGLVIIPLNTKDNLIIDFLSSVHGIDNAELKKQRIETRFKNAILFVMHPLHCLQSRVSNVIGLHRDNTSSIVQLKIAILVINRRLLRLLEAGQHRQALKEVEFVFQLAHHPKLGIPLFINYEVDVFDAIPEDVQFGEKFLALRYPQMKKILNTQRNKRKKLQQI